MLPVIFCIKALGEYFYAAASTRHSTLSCHFTTPPTFEAAADRRLVLCMYVYTYTYTHFLANQSEVQTSYTEPALRKAYRACIKAT